MRYLDGKTIKTGDIIWWNEGTCVGRVATIVEPADTAEKMAAWGLDESGIFISPRIRLPLVDGVYQPHSDFEDEGIGLMSENELAELYEAIEIAKAGFTGDVLKLGEPRITQEPHAQTRGWCWNIAFDPERDLAIEYNPDPIYSCRILRKDDN